MERLPIPLMVLFGCLLVSGAVAADESDESYAAIVRADNPIAWWRFDSAKGRRVADATAAGLHGQLVAAANIGHPGPRRERYPLFDAGNEALQIPSGGGYVRVSDPGKNSPLDFTAGDSLTLEAWVNPATLRHGSYLYVVGKGRTHRKGFPRDNQNYALRLKGESGQATLTFLFRDERNRSGTSEGWHRWTSKTGFAVDGRWHHVAVTYTFGQADSLRSYIDGKPVAGRWDMGGKTDRGPVVDDDELWIGSAMGGQRGSTFRGGIDEVAVYRTALSPERIRRRYKAKLPEPYVTDVPLPKDGVLVELMERIPAARNWSFPAPEPTLRYVVPAFGMAELPQKYNDKGLRIQWSNPCLVRMTGNVRLPEGEWQFLIRSRSAARLLIDGKLVVSNPFHSVSGGGHNPIRDVRKVKEEHIRTLQPGDSENLAVFRSSGKVHRVQFEVIVGGKNKRVEPGETCVAFRPAANSGSSAKQPFRLAGPVKARRERERAEGATPRVLLTPEGWLNYVDEQHSAFVRLNAKTRREKSADVAEFWNRRHERARRWLKRQPAIAVPTSGGSMPINNSVDRFINARLQKAGQQPGELTDDWQFLRRVTLDVTGTIPTPAQIQSFLNDESPHRRANYIDRLLKHPGWADHWTGYWQDVLAENPNILKPTLNNTGPFRWWIYESFLDNKPLDWFAAELVLMEGDKYVGAPAGFEMAAQNDAPMAAKAHVVGQAFLGVQMKCARCHDAPFHELKQKDLFSLAAMLKRGVQPVPKTSSVPLGEEAIESLIVEVTLKPGSRVKPRWPFAEISSPEDVRRVFDNGTAAKSEKTESWIDSQDPRKRLAALITAPTNTRFAQVMVNRIWARYMGRGLVEPVDDWEHADPSHPLLLRWLSREFIRSGYDLKHVARLILNSHAYQRKPVSITNWPTGKAYLFAAPLRRRMTAEQLVDSLFTAAGKGFHAGELNMDLDGARPYKTFLNLGRPRRSWQFASLSNERDRPSLAMPFSQDFVSVLKIFGWRASRQDPRTTREHDPTVLQPAILANGVVGRRITRLSDDSAFTELAVQRQPLKQFIRGVFLRMLSRPPSDDELTMFTTLLKPGYEDRVIDVDPSDVVRRFKRPAGVSWSNHLRPAANRLKIEMEKLVQRGDPPSVRLTTDWRLRAEDMIWALMNSPEFVFVP